MDQIMKERVDLLDSGSVKVIMWCIFRWWGVSTESGIPDFRSVDGLYNQQYDYPPETIISHSFYRKNRKSFTGFIKIRCCFRKRNPMRHIWP